MEEERKAGLISGGIALTIALAVRIISFLDTWPPSRSDQLGSALGAILGVMVCVYLALVWDPVYLRPIKGERRPMKGWLLLTVVMSGGIAVRLTERLFNTELNMFLGSTAITGALIVIGYMLIQVWRYRPRS